MNDGIVQVGNIFPDTDGFKNKTSGRVYSIEGLAPTLNTAQGGGISPTLTCNCDGLHRVELLCSVHPNSHKLEFDIRMSVKPIAPALRATDYKAPHCVWESQIVAMRGRDAQVLTAKRTEYGKQVRKQYESGELKTSRHTMQQLEPRNDGVSNTLTSVQKDNLLREPTFRIRKLTPTECFRLMGVDDKDIDTLLNASISNSQLYKLAGNSICVDCMVGIFRNAFTTEEVESNTLF